MSVFSTSLRPWRAILSAFSVASAELTQELDKSPIPLAGSQQIAGALGVDISVVGVKGKTNEGMGFIGRGEGIAVIAVATLEAR